MKKCISQNNLKSVYLENNTAIKVFSKDYNKSDVLYEALNTARVEDAGVNIPKLLSVSVNNGQWEITSEYADGITLTQLIKEHPEKTADYIKKMVEYQVDFQKKSNPLLLKLKDKLIRQINDIETLDSSVKYELLTRLNTMPKHTKLCHGDFCPDNIIVNIDDNADITSITAVDWVHATQGNASADAAMTYLLFALKDQGLADMYMDMFCKKSDTAKQYVQQWLPIVAASQLDKDNELEKDFLMKWIDVMDYQ